MAKISKTIEFIAKKFLSLSFVKKWMNKHPQIYRQLNERFTTKKFTGLPLTILTAIFLYALFLLIGITQGFLTNSPLVSVDIRITNLLYIFRSDTLLRFFYFITLFAESLVIVILSVVLSIFLWTNKQRIHIFSLWFALAVGEGLTFLGKYIFHRERPSVFLRTITEDSFSFPSGHATAVVLFYGFLVYLIFRNYTSLKTRIAVLSSLFLFVVLVDLSRLYLGVHYFSDVIAGNLVGLSALILSVGLTEWFISKKSKIIPNKTNVLQILSVFLIAIISVSVVYFSSNSPVNKNKPITIQKIKTEDVLSLFDDKKLSRFTETITGATQEPINMIVISQEPCFIKNIVLAKWILAERVSLSSTEHLAKTSILNQPYPTAPMTPSFFNAEPNDYGFEKQTDKNSVRTRHHARFWKTQYETPLGMLYVGTVSLDTGLKWGITHTIAPDIDTERDLFVSDLKKTGVVTEEKLIPFVSPEIGKNFSGDQFFTNGKASWIIFSSCEK